MHFSTPYLDVLMNILPHPTGIPEPGITVPLQQFRPALASETVVAGRTRSSAKTSSPETNPSGKATSIGEEGQAESAPFKKKRLRKKVSTPIDSENTESATEHNPIELNDYFEEEVEAEEKKLDLSDQEPEHETSSRTSEKPRSPIIQSVPSIIPPVEPELVNVVEEDKDEDQDSLFKSAQDLLKAATSGTSGSGLGSTSQSQFSSEEVSEAKTALRMALLQNFKAVAHPARASNVKKAIDVLVKSQALGIEEVSLPHFQKEFPSMVKSYDSSTHELSKINSKLLELEAVDAELTRFSTKWIQLKEDIKTNEANITTTSTEIQDLKGKLAQAEGHLDCLRTESKTLAQHHNDLKAGSKSQKMKLNLLVEEMPSLRGQRDTLETQLASLDTSWESLKNSLGGLL
ncbi:uncharacterized protein LOC131330312 [Rhododendron vialii]|uniref:uncharacterized protein LOC131330312 n=1 Tax=Rhododendron vialii TaxID=182163 RepID=UPI00265D9B36|nr:uncharacterized protein LOC131330312 [Rhododendron vialii]